MFWKPAHQKARGTDEGFLVPVAGQLLPLPFESRAARAGRTVNRIQAASSYSEIRLPGENGIAICRFSCS